VTAAGDLDTWVANRSQANLVWLNDGLGVYTDSGQALGSSWSQNVSLGDVDGDGDLDAWVANYIGDNRVWLNQDRLPGSSPAGAFTDGRVVW
jgi:hypothetical protein